MKSLGTITKRGLILSLCVLITAAFCFTPISASAYDGTDQIEKIAVEDGLSALGGSSESLRTYETLDDGTDYDEDTPTDPVDDQGVEITNFTLNRASGGSIVFDYDAVIPEGSDYVCMDMVYETGDLTGTESYVNSDEKEAWFYMNFLIGQVMQSGEVTDIPKDKDFDVTFTLYAVNENHETLAVSEPITVNIKVFDITEFAVSEIILPDRMTVTRGSYINTNLYAVYEYSWKADDSEPGHSQIQVPVGDVTSVTSGSPKVIKVEKEYGYYLNPLKKGSSKITVKYTLKGKSKTVTKTIKVSDSYINLQYRQAGKLNYSDMPSGTSAKYTYSAYMYTYNSSKGEFVFQGDVTDYVTFKMTGVEATSMETGKTSSTTKVKGSFSGNVLTIKADKSAPAMQYHIGFKASYGDVVNDDGYYMYIAPELDRVLVNDDFYFPLKGNTSTFDPTYVHYSKGTKKEQKIGKIVVYNDNCTIKDKAGTTINDGDTVKPSKLPLTIKAKTNEAYFRVEISKDGEENEYNYAYVYFSNRRMLSVYDVKLSSSAKTYTGKALKPTVSLKYAGKTISKTGYKITYLNNKNVGSATVKIQDKNDENIYRYVTFKINPKKPTIKTPAAVTKGLTAKWAKMSTKMSKERITGYQVQVATNKAFTKNKKSVKVAGYSKVSKKFTGLKAKTTYYVRVRTYKKIGRTTYYSPWSAVKNIKTK
ncbi:MAG: fibronectin type III domain-containing protein [Firmicutes bacterium]|nr:fibronectin type III domain-containing protein [Bacillota bacterium]